MSELESLRAEMAKAGIPFTGQFVGDDKVHRYKTAGDRDENCWYSLHQFPTMLVAVFGCWKRNIQSKWTSKPRKELSKEDWSAASQAWKDAEARRAEEERRAQEKVRARCAQWLRVFPRPDGHLYLAAKGVGAHGPLYQSDEELTRDWLALPLQDADGTVHSMQFIAEDGTKRFAYGGRVAGCYYPLSDVPGGPVLVCEGYATGASLFEATGWSVVCAMNCGNLLAVVQSLRKKYPSRTLVICADNDQFTEGNPGLTKAQAAAKAANCLLACPDFGDNALEGKPTDFNDLHTAAGLREVARQVYDAFPVVARSIGVFARPPENDPTELLKYRYLCQGGGLLFNGPTGVGKSSLSVQSAACWCNLKPFFGIRPSKSLSTVIIQAENDDGDVAEMRDGVCKGLGLTEEERYNFFSNVFIYSATKGVVGDRFCKELVRPLLDLHDPDLLMIDPMLSFVGGNVKEQEVVGNFLRASLNPVIFEHECGMIGYHHTNKPPTGKEKQAWANGELAYLGSGSAEWANWARAVLSLQSLGKAGYYKLHAAKRGARLGWTDGEGQLLYERYIAWSRDGSIYWREPTMEEIAMLEGSGQEDDKLQKKADKIPARFINLLKQRSLTRAEWAKRAKSELGYSNGNAYRYIKDLELAGRVFLSVATSRYSIVTERAEPGESAAAPTPEPSEPETATDAAPDLI